ncbi:MAG: FeoC-like transcriptional regulator [Gammaproteobacteria bacterium]|nr:FeoC-like transcriptional regulator [Gammaproteobacteria bacterium]
MLLALRDFIQAQQRVSMEQLSREFRVAEEALEPMVALWIKKGRVRQSNHADDCAIACRGCQPRRLVYYEWLQ